MTARTAQNADFVELLRLLGSGHPQPSPRPVGPNDFYVEPFYNRDYLAPVGPVRIVNHTELGENGAQLAERTARD
jgi:hypothetical protein